MHAEVLRYLLSRGMPPDVEDIVGYTALHHTTMASDSRLDLARILLESGANVDHQSRYGEVPLLRVLQINKVDCVDLLMEFGANMDIADANGLTPRACFLSYGPQVTATMMKWIRKRNGESAPMGAKECDACHQKGDNVKLKHCSRCHVVLYCSTGCQRK